MKKIIPVLFFIICLLGCASTNNVVNNKIVIPETEKTVLKDYNAPNPLLNTNVEGVFVLKQPYCDIEKYKNAREYRLYLLDKNTDEVLYIIENVVSNWPPSHNDGWGGRIVKDDFCCFTKDNVEYRIKGDIYAIEVHSYLEGIYLTEDGEDLLNPVIRDDIDEDIKKIEQGFVDYVLYPDLVERGFNIHKLDNMKIDGEMFEYIESFFRPNDEKGWLPLDNHHKLRIKDENGEWFYQNASYKKRVIFTKEYGSKDDLLEKGYVENETMFYYPSNGEKDWRIGEWSWFDYKGDWNSPSEYRNQKKSLSFVGEKLVKDDITHVETLETEKSFIITFLHFETGINDVELVEKDNLIIDMSYNTGGSMNSKDTFVERVLKSNYKKIIVIANDAGSSGDDIVEQLSKDKRTIVIGKNTNGTVIAGGYEYKIEIINANNKFYFKSMTNKYDTSIMEGIGFIPDIWANNELDVFKNIWNITDDYEIKTKDYSRIIDHDNYKSYENNKSWNY